MYKIVQVDMEQLNEVADLFNEYRIFYNKVSDPMGAKNYIHERLNNKDSVIFACNTGNGISGFAQLYPIFSSTRMQKQWQLNDLFVGKEHRGKGISRLLLDKCKELCRNSGACALTLETGKDNERANYLYRTSGFQQETETNFYTWHVD